MKADDDWKQLVVRVDPKLIHRLKLVAAYFDMSMAQLVRNTLEDEVSLQRRDPGVDQALTAAGL